MAIEIRVPTFGESVTEATVGQWFKKAGDAVKVDEPLVELETDKVTSRFRRRPPAFWPRSRSRRATTVAVGALLGAIEEGAGATPALAPAPARLRPPRLPLQRRPRRASRPLPAARRASCRPRPPRARSLDETGFDSADVAGSGKRGQVLKEDVAQRRRAPAPAAAPVAYASVRPSLPQQLRVPSAPNDAAREERVQMTRLRQTIARRLKDAQNTAAMLTTFNEVDMSASWRCATSTRSCSRRARREARLHVLLREGCVAGPEGDPGRQRRDRRRGHRLQELLPHRRRRRHRQGPRGPVVRDADRMNLRRDREDDRRFRQARARRQARRSRTCRAAPSRSPTAASTARCCRRRSSTRRSRASSACTVSRSAPWSRNGQVVIRPMMYLALSYDHRIVDGREAVTFLVRVKECLEDPERLRAGALRTAFRRVRSSIRSTSFSSCRSSSRRCGS